MAGNKQVGDVVVGFGEVKKAVFAAEQAGVGVAGPATAPALVHAGVPLTPVQQVTMLASLGEALNRMEAAEKEAGSGVLASPSHAIAARLQSFLAAHDLTIAGFNPLPAGGREIKFGTNDYFGWLLSLHDHVFKFQFHPQVRPQSTVPAPLPDGARMAVIGDWGTGLYGAPVLAQTVAADPNPYALLLHLGDVYYSGTLQEIKDRFLALWPKRTDGSVSRALNSNHEMYSGGFGYFTETLPAFGQESSYFAYQNDHWLLVMLDTGYVDHDLDGEQIEWVHLVAGQAGGRRVVLFSHHQLFSRLEDQGLKLLEKLGPLLASGKVGAWYWGHEHRCVVYDPHPAFGFLGRCIGHGGIPYTRTPVTGFPVSLQAPDGAVWRRFDPRGTAPGGLVLDGPNPYVGSGANKYGPHGYATLQFAGPIMTERVHAPDGTILYTNDIQ